VPKTPEQNRQIKDERKAMILQTALRLFAVRGYDSIVVDDIARAAGCSRGLFYHYFKNKEEVFIALIQLAEDRARVENHRDIDLHAQPAIEVIKSIVEQMLEEIFKSDDSPYFLYMFINMHLQKTLPLPAKEIHSKGHEKPFFRLFAELVARGQKEGDVAGGDPREFAIIYFSIIKGLCYTRLSMAEALPIKPSSDIIMNLFSRKGKYQ